MKLLDFVVRESIVVDLRHQVKSKRFARWSGASAAAGVSPATTSRASSAQFSGAKSSARPASEWAWRSRIRGIRRSSRLVGTVALSRRGVDFAALDGEPVDIFFLLVSPQNQPGDHLRALENISRHLKDERFVSSLRQARSQDKIIEVLEKADQGAL